MALYAVVRVDLRFHIPNGVHGAGAYSGGAGRKETTVLERVNTEEEDFDGKAEGDGGDLEAGHTPVPALRSDEGEKVPVAQPVPPTTEQAAESATEPVNSSP